MSRDQLDRALAILSCAVVIGVPVYLTWRPAPELPPMLVVLAGQSNMQGRTSPAGLGWRVREPPSNVRFFLWTRETDFQSQPWLGPEIAAAEVLADAFPDRSIWLVKAAVAGTSIEAWSPTWSPDSVTVPDNRRFGALYAQLVRSLRDLSSGRCLETVAIAWMQGERDARSRSGARQYRDRLTGLIDSFQTDLGVPDLPFVVGMVSAPRDRYPFSEAVQSAQIEAASQRSGIHLVDTRPMPRLPDGVHLSWQGSRSLGTRIAQALIPHVRSAGHGLDTPSPQASLRCGPRSR